MIWDKLFGEVVDVIDWTDDSNDTLVYRFQRRDNAIKYGAKLTVREGQAAVFVNEGEIADVFEPGMYELLTANLPILSTLQAWKHGFESPFKAEVYFFSTRRFPNLKWGTKNPVMLRDAEFGPIRLRAFGTYEIRVAKPDVCLRELVGTDGHFTTDEITGQLRSLIVSRFAEALGGSGVPALDLAANYDKLSTFVTNRIAPEIAAFGLDLTRMTVENVSLPKAVEEAMDKRTQMGVIGDLGRYSQFQAAEAMRAAAENPSGGGAAAAGLGAGAGFAMAGQMMQAFQGPWGQRPAQQMAPAPMQAAPVEAAPAAAPPPLPVQKLWHAAIGGEAIGPMTIEELSRRVAQGEMSRATLVWTKGMANWTKAGEVSDLALLFPAAPPPLPPA